tara:strand:+ start:2546 stop:3349 length:804 start_codon:yes stop_codon:yes gene_type:complete
MPELPEVETICNAIEQSIDSPKIDKFKIINNKLRWKISGNIPSRVNGQVIKKIYRRAKYIIFEFDHGCLITHLGMTGQFRRIQNDYTSHKHDHFLIKMSDDNIYVYNDVRKFGSIHWSANVDKHFLMKNIGIEPLTEGFNSRYLKNRTTKSKMKIKNFIMDQKIIAGVGNIYASEALFLSKIRPNKIANKLSKSMCDHLVKSIKVVLRKAIKYGGTSIKDYKTLDGNSGYFTQKLSVYGLDRCKCGEKIKNVKISGRSSFYCPKCQK